MVEHSTITFTFVGEERIEQVTDKDMENMLNDFENVVNVSRILKRG